MHTIQMGLSPLPYSLLIKTNKETKKPSKVARVCNPNTEEVQTGTSLGLFSSEFQTNERPCPIKHKYVTQKKQKKAKHNSFMFEAGGFMTCRQVQ